MTMAEINNLLFNSGRKGRNAEPEKRDGTEEGRTIERGDGDGAGAGEERAESSSSSEESSGGEEPTTIEVPATAATDDGDV